MPFETLRREIDRIFDRRIQGAPSTCALAE